MSLIEELESLSEETQDDLLAWLSEGPSPEEYERFCGLRDRLSPPLYRKLDSVLSRKLSERNE